MSDPTAANDVPAGAPVQPQGQARASRANLTKVLPTDRVSFEKQIAALRAYAAASGPGKRPVSNDEVAAVMAGLAASSISLCNPFFNDAGLLIQEGRKMRPAEVAFDLLHAHEWNSETAGLKLFPVFSQHWAAAALLPKLAFRKVTKDEAIAFLAEESKAATGHRKSLETLLDFLAYAGVLQVDGNMVNKVSPALFDQVAKGDEVADSKPSDVPPQQAAGSSSGQTGAPQGLDPMIHGLFLKLPAPDSEWELGDRVKWLRTAANIFDLVYSSSGSGDIKISPRSGQEE